MPLYVVDPAVDVPLLVAVGGPWLALSAIHEEAPAPPALPLDVPPWDRVALGRWAPGVARVSDASLVGVAALSVGVGAAAAGRSGDALGPAVVLAESAAVTGLAVDLTKRAVGRPRPYWSMSDGVGLAEAKADADAFRSFPSGHTALTASLAFTAARMADDADLAPAWVGYTGAGALTVGMASMRVLAGKHFPTDVAAGAAIGAGVGLLVPALHRPDGEAVARLAPAGPFTWTVSGTW